MANYTRGLTKAKLENIFNYLMNQEYERLEGTDRSLAVVAKRHRCNLNPISDQEWNIIHRNCELAVFERTPKEYQTEDYDNRIDYRGELEAPCMKIAILVELFKNTMDFETVGKEYRQPMIKETKITLSLLMALHLLKDTGGQ